MPLVVLARSSRIGALVVSILLAQSVASTQRLTIDIGQPSIWSLGQAHYLLANMHQEKRALRVPMPTDALNPSSIGAARLDLLRSVFSGELQYSQPQGSQNRMGLERYRADFKRREMLRQALDVKRSQLQGVSRDLNVEPAGGDARSLTGCRRPGGVHEPAQPCAASRYRQSRSGHRRANLGAAAPQHRDRRAVDRGARARAGHAGAERADTRRLYPAARRHGALPEGRVQVTLETDLEYQGLPVSNAGDFASGAANAYFTYLKKK